MNKTTLPDTTNITSLTVFYDAKQSKWFVNFWTSVQNVIHCPEEYAILSLKRGYDFVFIA